MVKVAVIMVAYNAEKHIEDALQSVLRQRDAADFDLIVVDDGSTDNTQQIVRDLAKGAGEIRLIESTHQGVSRARNVALDALAEDTEIVTFVDADDLSPEDRFARDLVAFRDDPDLQVSYGKLRMFRQVGADRFLPDAAGPVSDVRGVSLGALMFRPSLLKTVMPFDTSLEHFEDLDFLFRIFESGPRYELTDDICIYYRRHETNMTRDTQTGRRDYAQAVMKSLRRRKSGDCAPLPAGLFVPDSDAETKDIKW